MKKTKKWMPLLLAFMLLTSCTGTVKNEAEAPNPFSYVVLDSGSISLTGYTGTETDLKIPEALDGHPVVQIAESCFAGNYHLERVWVPEGIVELGDYAFECCSSLKKIYLPDSLTIIGDGAFSGCVNLYLVDIQDSTESIGGGAFLRCTSLISFVAPKSLKTLGDFAFADCANLVRGDFIESVLEEVPDRLFYRCGSLETIRLPETVQSVGKRAFGYCGDLRYMYLPETVKTVGPYAFEYCESLSSIDMHYDVIEPYTFHCCHALEYVNLPETLKSIGVGAFRETGIIPEETEIPAYAEVDEFAFLSDGEDDVITDVWGAPIGEEEEPSAPAEALKATVAVAELEEKAEEQGFHSVATADFEKWSEAYLAFNEGKAPLTEELNPYIALYKQEIDYNFIAMTAAASGVPAEIASAGENFGDDFVPMYTMINHGLTTEMRRFSMAEDMLLYTGVYDFQLSEAAGTEGKPTLDELKARIGTTFTDTSLTSTTTDAAVAYGFSDTLFVIYAPAAALNQLGTVCMDSYMHTPENEILLASGASYEIMDVGVMSAPIETEGTVAEETRAYVLLRLMEGTEK